MIDAETDIFAYVSEKAREAFPNLYLTGEYVRSPSSFPCVSLIEMDNAALQDTQTSENTENHVTVLYELNVYSNKAKGKKAECKKIASFFSDLLTQLNFTRILLEPVPNQNDATIYRILGRFRAVISQDKTIYRR